MLIIAIQKIIQIINYIVKNLKGGQPILGVIKLRKDETYKIFPDIKKAKQFINWKPKVDLDEGEKIAKSYLSK